MKPRAVATGAVPTPAVPTRAVPTRAAFTLIEVITAITLTAIVLTIAGTALAAASDARATIERHQQTLDAESRWRARVTDMLRHAPPADQVNEPLLRITRSPEVGTTLVFLSRGVMQPFGTGPIWRVTLSGGPSGVSLDAEAIGRGARATRLHTMLPHLTTLDVAVLEQNAGGAPAWRLDWPVERTRPALLRLDLGAVASGSAQESTRANARAVPPLLVNLAPLVPFNTVSNVQP